MKAKQTKNASKSVPASKWQWFGGAGHFICGRWCRFHLATQVGDYLVSTVGEYVHPRHAAGSEVAEAEWLRDNWPGEDVGCERKYETMVFKAGNPCIVPGCGCGLPEHTGRELDFDGYNTAGSARAGHMAMCAKWAKKGSAK